MCLLIHQPKGYTLPASVLRSAATKNPDGFGVMWAERGKVRTFRMVGTADEMTAAYHAHAAGKECYVHWRMTTHGATNVENAHPFRVSSTCAVMHNGVIDIERPRREMSDTWHFSEYVVRPALIAGLVRSPEWLAVARGIIGRGSKVAILHGDGTSVILNREAGVEYDGVWYSNLYAWNPPAELVPTHERGSYSRYAGSWWEGGDDWRTLPRGETVTAAKATTATSADADADELEAAERAFFKAMEGTDGTTEEGERVALEWLSASVDNAVMAVHILEAWFNFAPGEALELVANSPASAADYLASVAVG